jgi:transcriptional regulator with XRE-family HTH domain
MPQGDFVNFGEKLKQLRAERNLTQPQLAQAIGIEQSYLSKLENDKSVPSADVFQAVLKAFAIDVAGFLNGIDERIVNRDLRQIPEVAQHVSARSGVRIHSVKRWLYCSAVAATLGLTLVVAGYRGLLFSNQQFSYHSPGVVLPGEPTNIFETYDHLTVTKLNSGTISHPERAALLEAFSKRAQRSDLLLTDYRGEGFIEAVPGGLRNYTLARVSEHERHANRWITLFGVLLTFGGILGFVVEQRLRSLRVT